MMTATSRSVALRGLTPPFIGAAHWGDRHHLGSVPSPIRTERGPSSSFSYPLSVLNSFFYCAITVKLTV